MSPKEVLEYAKTNDASSSIQIHGHSEPAASRLVSDQPVERGKL